MSEDSARTTLFTIGYERSLTTDTLVARLTEVAIERLVDVRAVPHSRRPGFSKGSLEPALAAPGIHYEHWSDLGNVRSSRELYKSGYLEGGRDLYRLHIRDGASRAVDALADTLPLFRTALMCLEHDPALCHRDVLAGEIATRRPEVEVIDL